MLTFLLGAYRQYRVDISDVFQIPSDWFGYVVLYSEVVQNIWLFFGAECWRKADSSLNNENCIRAYPYWPTSGSLCYYWNEEALLILHCQLLHQEWTLVGDAPAV